MPPLFGQREFLYGLFFLRGLTIDGTKYRFSVGEGEV